MLQHLRACAWLLGLTLILCCVVYPLALWGIGHAVFRHQADGSILLGPDHKPVGSRLIAQKFNGDEYFQPRPTATAGSDYNAMASGGSNLAASNPKLRGRVSQALGLLVRFESPDGPGKGKLAGDEVETWFQSLNDPQKGDKRRDLTAEWASRNPSLVVGWATSSDLIGDFIKKWANEHLLVLAAWKQESPPRAEDLAPFLFDPAIADSFVSRHPGMWPCTIEEEQGGKKEKVIKPDNKGDDIRSYFFDMWLQEHRDVKLEKVPADMVTTSGSGLDPHITLKNAHVQMERVAEAWAKKKNRDIAGVRPIVRKVIEEKTEAPLSGWVGVPMVNVLEVNLLLIERLK
jgi:K+-transporting ATPase ATPase C chain